MSDDTFTYSLSILFILHMHASSRPTNLSTKARRNQYISSQPLGKTTNRTLRKTAAFGELYTRYKGNILGMSNRVIYTDGRWSHALVAFNNVRCGETCSFRILRKNNLISFNFHHEFSHRIHLKTSHIFNLTEWEGMLSSRCILNIKRLVTLKYKQRKSSNAGSENNLKDCQ